MAAQLRAATPTPQREERLRAGCAPDSREAALSSRDIAPRSSIRLLSSLPISRAAALAGRLWQRHAPSHSCSTGAAQFHRAACAATSRTACRCTLPKNVGFRDLARSHRNARRPRAGQVVHGAPRCLPGAYQELRAVCARDVRRLPVLPRAPRPRTPALHCPFALSTARSKAARSKPLAQSRSLKSRSLKSRSLNSRSLNSRSLKSRSLKSRSLKSRSLKSQIGRAHV